MSYPIKACILKLENLPNYKIAGDFDWMLRLLNSKNLSFTFSNEIIYTMKAGGVSNAELFLKLKSFFEDIKIIKIHGYNFPFYRAIYKK